MHMQIQEEFRRFIALRLHPNPATKPGQRWQCPVSATKFDCKLTRLLDTYLFNTKRNLDLEPGILGNNSKLDTARCLPLISYRNIMNQNSTAFPATSYARQINVVIRQLHIAKPQFGICQRRILPAACVYPKVIDLVPSNWSSAQPEIIPQRKPEIAPTSPIHLQVAVEVITSFSTGGILRTKEQQQALVVRLGRMKPKAQMRVFRQVTGKTHSRYPNCLRQIPP